MPRDRTVPLRGFTAGFGIKKTGGVYGWLDSRYTRTEDMPSIPRPCLAARIRGSRRSLAGVVLWEAWERGSTLLSLRQPVEFHRSSPCTDTEVRGSMAAHATERLREDINTVMKIKIIRQAAKFNMAECRGMVGRLCQDTK